MLSEKPAYPRELEGSGGVVLGAGGDRGAKPAESRRTRLSLFRQLWVACIVALSVAIWDPASIHAASEEYELKAAFIYNFVKFLEWPPEAFDGAEEPIVICTLGESPLTKVVMGLEGRVLQKRRLTVRSIEKLNSARKCHVLLISGFEGRASPSLDAFLASMPYLLTVSDEKGFAERLGMIEMLLIENRVRFDVNLGLIRKSSLKVSSHLLKLARRIIE